MSDSILFLPIQKFLIVATMARFKDSFFGGLSGKIGPVVTYVRNGHTVLFSWDSQIQKPSDGSRNDDRVNIVYLNTTFSGAGQLLSAAKRADGRATLSIPNGWKPEETLFWIYLTSPDLQLNSDSMFVQL